MYYSLFVFHCPLMTQFCLELCTHYTKCQTRTSYIIRTINSANVQISHLFYQMSRCISANATHPDRNITRPKVTRFICPFICGLRHSQQFISNEATFNIFLGIFQENCRNIHWHRYHNRVWYLQFSLCILFSLSAL